jgi:adenosylmethionine-8-amino-7-oxononanoate transaminase
MNNPEPYRPEDIRQWDREHVWHPFTPMRDYDQSDPVIVASGQGSTVTDIDGRTYYDGVASIWLNVHGHRVPAIDAAIRDQLEAIAHSTLLGQGSVPVSILAKKLAELTPPGLTRFFFSESGASAVEVALKMAVQYWANQGVNTKTKILGFTSNYHGDTLGAMAVAPDPIFHWPFLAYLPPEPRVAYPYCYRCPLGQQWPQCQLACVALVEEAIRTHRDELAAVIIEPVQGAGGIIPAPPGYLRAVRELCDRYEVLLIVDEVATGFGRTGRFWGVDWDSVRPDILCIGKALSGGYLPISATVATEAIYQVFYATAGERRALYHGHSYAGNALACRAALANLELMEQERVVEQVGPKSAVVGEALSRVQGLPYVGDVRQRGLMVGVELVRDRSQKTPFAYDVQAGWVVAREARRRELLIRPIGNVVIFMPPIGVPRADIVVMAERFVDAMVAAQPALEALAAGKEARP